MKPPRVLVVDDEEDMLYACRRILGGVAVEVVTACGGAAALELLGSGPFDALLVDLVMPGVGGMEVLKASRGLAPEPEVILMTAHPTVETAVQAVKDGAFGYITKPFTPEQVRMTLETALAHRSLKVENLRLRAHLRRSGARAPMIGRGPAFRECLALIRKAAESDCNVLILGETGTGKELAAQTIHALSRRREKPFVPLNCGALSETILESELFGHERGAFTGAHRCRIGLLEYAQGGTVLLDEVSEMSGRLQVALLRVLQEGQFRRLGGNVLLETDARVLAAINRPIDEAVRSGAFREDLLFRLDVLRIRLPPLRDRPEDVPPLVDHILERLNGRRERPIVGIHPEAMARLCAYRWPGNIRELQNVLERAALLAGSDVITPEDLPHEFRARSAPPSEPAADFQRKRRLALEQFERDYLATVLAGTDGNVRQAARLAGMPRSSLQRLLRRYGLGGHGRGGGPQDGGPAAAPRPPA